MSTRPRAWSPRALLRVAIAGSLLVLAGSPQLHAQQSAVFTHGVVVDGDWLQANALPLDRNAMHSIDGTLSIRRGSWAVDAGWLRIARSLSTIQGGTLSASWLLPWRGVLFMPTIGGLGGRAERSVDSTGYDWVNPQNGVRGHTPRYTYSSGSTVGGSVGLAVEIPVYRIIAIRGLASQWFFSGTPLEGDRTRTVLGAGLSLRVGR